MVLKSVVPISRLRKKMFHHSMMSLNHKINNLNRVVPSQICLQTKTKAWDWVPLINLLVLQNLPSWSNSKSNAHHITNWCQKKTAKKLAVMESSMMPAGSKSTMKMHLRFFKSKDKNHWSSWTSTLHCTNLSLQKVRKVYATKALNISRKLDIWALTRKRYRDGFQMNRCS